MHSLLDSRPERCSVGWHFPILPTLTEEGADGYLPVYDKATNINNRTESVSVFNLFNPPPSNIPTTTDRLCHPLSDTMEEQYPRQVPPAYKSLYTQHLASMLFYDYLYPNFDYRMSPWCEAVAFTIREHRAGRVRTEYQDVVVLPLQEIALDRSHVEDRILLSRWDTKRACEQQLEMMERRQPPLQVHGRGGFVKRLIQRCEWQSLARMLINDRALARALDPECFASIGGFETARVLQTIQRAIDNIEMDYFLLLSSPTDFFIGWWAIAQEILLDYEGKSALADRRVPRE